MGLIITTEKKLKKLIKEQVKEELKILANAEKKKLEAFYARHGHYLKPGSVRLVDWSELESERGSQQHDQPYGVYREEGVLPTIEPMGSKKRKRLEKRLRALARLLAKEERIECEGERKEDTFLEIKLIEAVREFSENTRDNIKFFRTLRHK